MSSGDHPQGRPEGNQSRPKPEPKHWLDIITFFFVIAAAIAAGFAAYYTRKQWITAHDTLVVSERAFVHGNVVPVGARDPNPTVGEFLGMQTTFANSGNTRTRELRFLVRCATSPTRLVEPWGLLHQEAEEHLPQVIAPKTGIFAFCGFQRPQVADMFAGRLYGYVLGDVTYKDVFDSESTHVTQISLGVAVISYTESPFSAPAHLAPVGSHNCADEDCPK